MRFSIITCTYNPNKLIFERLINAISQLIVENHELDWIVVDNNSDVCIQDNFDFTKVRIPVIHVLEKKAGLTNARIAGALAAKGNWLIFFDDDNEPDKTYLKELSKGIQKYPNVNCWGAGTINVEYIGKVHPWYEANKDRFQQRRDSTMYGAERYMQNYYPIGTGLSITKIAIGRPEVTRLT